MLNEVLLWQAYRGSHNSYGSCVAVLCDRMVVFCLSYSLIVNDSDDLFLDAIGQHGGKLHCKLGKFFRKKSANSNLSIYLSTNTATPPHGDYVQVGSLDRITDFSFLSFFVYHFNL